ncbi:hypothetical protein QTV49_004792 [Vibrio vulnificus]|nr:hypothetical protein [Vibrio vulnificus]
MIFFKIRVISFGDLVSFFKIKENTVMRKFIFLGALLATSSWSVSAISVMDESYDASDVRVFYAGTADASSGRVFTVSAASTKTALPPSTPSTPPPTEFTGDSDLLYVGEPIDPSAPVDSGPFYFEEPSTPPPEGLDPLIYPVQGGIKSEEEMAVNYFEFNPSAGGTISEVGSW